MEPHTAAPMPETPSPSELVVGVPTPPHEPNEELLARGVAEPIGRVSPARQRPRTRRTVRPEDASGRPVFTARDRLLLLDTLRRSGLTVTDFSRLSGVSAHSLYEWRRRFELEGPAGLESRPRGRRTGSRLPEETRRAILMMKAAHLEWGCERIRDVLIRSQGHSASPGAIARVLAEDGYVVEDVQTKPHRDRPRRFERARPNELWQSDIFTFTLKRENVRVYLVAYLDDQSRYLVGYGLHASASSALVREVLLAAIANFGAPKEVLTDQGPQYYSWRGKSAFRKLLDRRGIRHVVAAARHPQTLGKTERFWGTLWRECVEVAIFRGLEDARRRIGLFIDHYNFQRPHRGIDGLVPADRFFGAAPQVKETLAARVAANSLELARHGTPRKTFYLTGRVGDESLSLHAEGERVVLTKEDGTREEVDLAAPGRRSVDDEDVTDPEPVAVVGTLPPPPGFDEGEMQELPPGVSRLDAILAEPPEPEDSEDASPEEDPS